MIALLAVTLHLEVLKEATGERHVLDIGGGGIVEAWWLKVVSWVGGFYGMPLSAQ